MPILLFASTFDNPDEWRRALTAAMPDLDVIVHPGEVFAPQDIDYALVWKPPSGLLAGLPNLKATFSLGAGVDHILTDASYPRRRVPVVRMVDPVLGELVADYVVAAVCALHRGFIAYGASQRAGRWRRGTILRTQERRVGILGLGEIGTLAAERLAGLGFPLCGWSRTPKEIPGVESFAGQDRLSDFLGRCDILVCLLPATPQTAGILNGATFAALPDGAMLVNAGRGSHVVEDDLIAALDDGRLSGAVLDVFAEEPLPADHPFWRHPGILVTPHVAGTLRPESCAGRVAAGIKALEAGRRPDHIADPEAGY